MSCANLPSGFWPVMLTPFTERGDIDWPAYDELIRWYVRTGASGLFASCLSSEFFHITEEERFALARRAVECAGGRLPVIAAGPVGPDVEKMADTAKRLADVGISAVICLSNQFGEAPLNDERGHSQWKAQMERWLALLPKNLPLGIYECPKPRVCNLPPELLGWLARTGRFFTTKDTACDAAVIREKIGQISGTALRFYNADSVTLLGSLEAGGHGYSGIAGNYFGHLFSWICARHASHPEQARALAEFFADTNVLVHRKYMTSAKYYLRKHGLRMTTRTRAVQNTLEAEDMAALDKL